MKLNKLFKHHYSIHNNAINSFSSFFYLYLFIYLFIYFKEHFPPSTENVFEFAFKNAAILGRDAGFLTFCPREAKGVGPFFFKNSIKAVLYVASSPPPLPDDDAAACVFAANTTAAAAAAAKATEYIYSKKKGS